MSSILNDHIALPIMWTIEPKMVNNIEHVTQSLLNTRSFDVRSETNTAQT